MAMICHRAGRWIETGKRSDESTILGTLTGTRATPFRYPDVRVGCDGWWLPRVNAPVRTRQQGEVRTWRTTSSG